MTKDLQYRLDFGGEDSFRESLIERLEAEAREKILSKSKYGNLNNIGMTYPEKVEYMRYIIEGEFSKPSTDLSDKQLFPIYRKIQEKKITEYVTQRLPEVDKRVSDISDIVDGVSNGKKTFTEAFDEHIKNLRKNKA
ncbi:MAG: hypothetical protein ACOCUR_02700 [Nanoarchaeota archaeon]